MEHTGKRVDVHTVRSDMCHCVYITTRTTSKNDQLMISEVTIYTEDDKELLEVLKELKSYTEECIKEIEDEESTADDTDSN